MGWLVLPWAAVMAMIGTSVGSPTGVLLSILLAVLTAPLLWKRIKAKGHKTYAATRWTTACAAGIAALIFNGAAYSETPEGRAAAAQRIAKEQEKQRSQASERAASEAADKAREDTRIASGEHCLSGWDGSFPALKDAVKRQLRDPRSFDHVETVRSPVDRKGTFGLIMTYRAENGFGGMNVEAIGVEVDARTCSFRQASATALARRLHS